MWPFSSCVRMYTVVFVVESCFGAGVQCVGESMVLLTPSGQRGVERMNAVVQGLVLRRMKSDLGMNGKELVRGGLFC